MQRARWRPGVAALTILASLALAGCGADDRAPSGAGTLAAVETPAGGSVLTGAEPGERTSSSIKVAAAADLRLVLAAMQPAMETGCETRLTFVFGSSGQLKNQVEAGADFGLFLSADIQYPADLAKGGRVVPNGVAAYGVGRIVLALRPGLEPMTSLAQLSRPDIKHVAIANPDHAPYGRAARQALQSAGVYADTERKLVLGENIRQATDYVERGDADAGIVALALVIRGSPASYTVIDAALHAPIVQGGAVIRGTGAELTGRCLLEYILGPQGQSALAQYGFEPVKP